MKGRSWRGMKMVGGLLARLRGKSGRPPVKKSNRATAVDVDRYQETSGVGQEWARTVYGDYYASSVPVYSAIKIRSDALARPPIVVLRQAQQRSGGSMDRVAGPPTSPGPLGQKGEGGFLPVGGDHPVQRLLDRGNRWHTRGDLWRATEVYLSLWGSAFWGLEQDQEGRWEMWPLRPDRVRILPDKNRYIRGYVYFGATGPVAYTPEELIWIRYFNPLEEYAGLSPVAPLRLSADMGMDALKFNRNFFKNSAQPDVIFTTEEAMSDERRGGGRLLSAMGAAV